MIHSIIDPRVPFGTATGQLLQWNDATGLFELTTTLTGITLGSPWTLAGDGSWTGSNRFFDISDGGKTILINGTAGFQFSLGVDNWLGLLTASNQIAFGNGNDDPNFNFLGTGLTTLGGDIDVTGKIRVNGGFIGDNADPQLIEIDGAAGEVTVHGDFIVDDSLTVNTDLIVADSALGVVGIGAIPAAATSKLDVVYDTTSISSRIALSGLVTASPSANTGGFYRGILGKVEIADPAFNLTGRVIGLEGNVNYSDVTTGITTDEIFGAIASYNVTLFNAGATVSCVTGLAIVPTMIIALGSVTDHIGINIPDITGATNNFSIKSAGGSMVHAGNVRIGDTTTPTHKLEVKADSIVVVDSQSPASNGTGTQGEMAWDADYVYVCTATDTWKRSALTGGY